LNDLLSALAKAGGEIILREMGEDTVKKIAGPGAVWVGVDQARAIDSIYIDIVANSNGRPNKALDTANFQLIAPTLMAAGANPQFIVREAIKRLDDQMEPDEAFPLMAPQQTKQSIPVGQQSTPTSSGQMPARTDALPKVSPQGALQIQPRVL
jgi:hypothetical protein